MNEFLEQLVSEIRDWCAVIFGQEFRVGLERSIAQSFGATWGNHDPAFTIRVLADFVITETLVAALAILGLRLEEAAAPEACDIVVFAAESAIVAQAASRGVTNFVIFLQRALENGYGLLSAFPPARRAALAGELVSSTLCDLFFQIEDEQDTGKGTRRANTAPLSEFLAEYLHFLLELLEDLVPLP
jgi:hypothetical protein